MDLVAQWTAVGLLAASVVTDLRDRTIPNTFVCALIALFAVEATGGRLGGVADIAMHLACAAAVFCTGFLLYARGGLGAGDVKLMTAIVALVGPHGMYVFLCLLGFCALVLAAVAMLPLERARAMRTTLPFAVAIAPAGIGALLVHA